MNRHAKGLHTLRMTNSVVHEETLNRDAPSVIYIIIEKVLPHTVGGAQAPWNCSHFWYSHYNLKTTRLCFGWPPFKGTSPSNVHDVLCHKQHASSSAVSCNKWNQDWRERTLYLILSSLKAGLCCTTDEAGTPIPTTTPATAPYLQSVFRTTY